MQKFAPYNYEKNFAIIKEKRSFMIIEDEIFKRYSPDFKTLDKYGFKENKDDFSFEKLFKNGEFIAKIVITKSGKIRGNVYETESNEEFLPLRVENQQGAFVGEVREEYKKILIDIRNKCFSQNYFISKQANRITNAIITEYGDKPDFMWEQYRGYGVFKNADNDKWYGLIMNIDYSKLGDDNNTPVEIIDLKLDKEKIQMLLKEKGFYPAWHMNKKSWITITLDDTLSDEMILNLVRESHSYTVEPQREWIVPANPEYFDIINAFENNNEIIWKQSSKIQKGDIAYMYVASPVSAIMYKCKVIQVSIPYDYEDKNIKINKVMKIKFLKKYSRDFMTFEKLNKYGIKAIRGQRTCPKELADILK